MRQCRTALNRLVTAFDGLDPDLRAKHIPRRTVTCRVKDLDVTFSALVDPDGVHDLAQVSTLAATPPAEVRITVASDDLVALADGREDLMTAWLHGKIQVSAPMRDMLRLRSVLSL